MYSRPTDDEKYENRVETAGRSTGVFFPEPYINSTCSRPQQMSAVSTVTTQQPNLLPLNYGSNCNSVLQSRFNPFLSIGTPMPYLSQELVQQYGDRQLERGYFPYLSTPSLNSMACNNDFLTQSEVGIGARELGSISLEGRFPGRQKWHHPSFKSSGNSSMENKERCISSEEKVDFSPEACISNNRKLQPSPVHDNGNLHVIKRKYGSSSWKMDSINYEDRTSRSQKQLHPSVDNDRHSNVERRKHSSSLRESHSFNVKYTNSGSQKHVSSPVQSDGSPHVEKRECYTMDAKTYKDRPLKSKGTISRSLLSQHEKTMPKSSSGTSRDSYKSSSRALRCYCLPEQNVRRTMIYERSDKYYIKSPELSSAKSTCVATGDLAKLHKEFEEMLSQTASQMSSGTSNSVDANADMEDDSQYVSELLDKTELDGGSSSESEVDLEDYITVDESDSDTSQDSKRTQSWQSKSIKIKNRTHPRRLSPELWFNVEGELNHERECLCSSQDKKKWIVHSIYPNEQMPEACDALGNNSLRLYHYWVTVSPHTNFMTENPTTIECHGRSYTFEGFSLLSHSPLDAVPRCFLTRFNIKYEIFFIQEPIPDNFCIKDLNLCSRYLFHDILEMFDWDVGNKGNEENCHLFHFLPRFTRKIGVSKDGYEKYELLSTRRVLEHLLKNRRPLIQDVDWTDRSAWKEFVASCVNSIVTKPSWKPSSLRVDDIERPRKGEKEDPVLIHNGIRPVQLSFSGDKKCQRLLKSYLRLRNSIMNRPDTAQKERLALIKMKLTLDSMRMKDSLRRDCYVRVSAGGMLKTGINSDVTQHALLLPVLVHHIRYHLSLQTFDEKIGYKFKNRALVQLALTHPSYMMNYGTNPDHARNTLSNCGVKKPRYGDKRNRFKYAKKKGIAHLIKIMAKLEDLEGSQSFIQHNERLEFLGDAVLEFICTSHLFYLFPEMSEGELVTHRSSLVQNRHLACVAKNINLDTYMLFSHGPDLCHEEDMDHAMANCFEALLGAIYLDSDINTVRKVFCRLAFDETELRELWSNLPPHPLQAHQPKGDRRFIQSSDVLKKLAKFEESVGVQFTHIRLLAKAFTHPQVGFNNLTLGSNQRMELLGDSVVQWVVTEYLYRHFPEHHEGHLTLLRSSLVNRNIQAEIAGEIGLNQYVIFGVGQAVPKLRQKHMADLLEAFLAALFIDKGIEPVQVFCKVCLFPRLRGVIVNQEWLDAKSQLQSCCLTQAKHTDGIPVYKVLKNVGSPNMKLYTVGVYFNGRRLGTGEGDNVREAEMTAAQDALASNYFPEYARQRRVLKQKHKNIKNVSQR